MLKKRVKLFMFILCTRNGNDYDTIGILILFKHHLVLFGCLSKWCTRMWVTHCLFPNLVLLLLWLFFLSLSLFCTAHGIIWFYRGGNSSGGDREGQRSLTNIPPVPYDRILMFPSDFRILLMNEHKHCFSLVLLVWHGGAVDISLHDLLIVTMRKAILCFCNLLSKFR